jgi:hypothetical protein
MIKYKYFVAMILTPYAGTPEDQFYKIGNLIYIAKKPITEQKQIRKLERQIRKRFNAESASIINYKLLRKINIDINVNAE